MRDIIEKRRKRLKTVGVIGNGFVGESQAFAFGPTAEVKIFDVDPLKSMHSLEEVHACDFIFVCVPTPMKKDGSQDSFYIESVFNHAKKGSIYIIKSTVLPGTTVDLQEKYPHLNIVFCPEFLTQRTAKLDTMTQARIILGGDPLITDQVEKLFAERFMNRHYIHTDATTAELVKYMNNTFFATKVSIMNEFKRISDALGTNWDDALYGFVCDGRVGDSHLHVPGPDGKLGYGGVCFPKDVNALITLGRELGTPMHTLEAGWKTNLEVRPEQDWQKLKGKAVSE
jgi:UDPglucose 6-dehydrogenase